MFTNVRAACHQSSRSVCQVSYIDGVVIKLVWPDAVVLVRSHVLSPLACLCPVQVSLCQARFCLRRSVDSTGERDLGVRGIVRYTPHSRRPPVPTVLTATLWDAPQHSEKPQPGASVTVLQTWVDLLDQTAGSSVPRVWETMSEEGGFMLCCRVRTLSTNCVRCAWLAPVLDTTMHADSPFNKLKAALHSSGSPVHPT